MKKSHTHDAWWRSIKKDVRRGGKGSGQEENEEYEENEGLGITRNMEPPPITSHRTSPPKSCMLRRQPLTALNLPATALRAPPGFSFPPLLSRYFGVSGPCANIPGILPAGADPGNHTVTIRHTILTASTYPTVPQKDDQCSWEQGYLQRRSEMAHTPARHLRFRPCHACDGGT